MLDLIRREKKGRRSTASSTFLSARSPGLLRPLSAAELLDTPHRRRWLEEIWQCTCLSRQQFAELYGQPIQRYAQYVQQFPASESQHHIHLGGMLDHGLQRAVIALQLRKSRRLPVSAPAETQAAQSEAWTAAVTYAALLHDIGKIAVNFEVEYADGTRWHPWHGALNRDYRFRHRRDCEYQLHNAAAGLLYARILDPAILDWLNDYPQLWSSLVYLLTGQPKRAGVLGELVAQADGASVAQEVGSESADGQSAPKSALHRKLLEGLRYLLKEGLRLNQLKASDGWLTDDLWLVSKTACDKLRAHLQSHGMEGIPHQNASLGRLLLEHGIVQPAPNGNAIWKATVTSNAGWSSRCKFLRLQPSMILSDDARPPSFEGTVQVDTPTDTNSMFVGVATKPGAQSALQISPGMQFISWLRESVEARRIVINERKALVHVTAGAAFLASPGIFQRYMQEHPHISKPMKEQWGSDWQWLQKHFESLKLHRKQSSGLNIWILEMHGASKPRRLHGYLLKDASAVFAQTPLSNPNAKVLVSEETATTVP